MGAGIGADVVGARAETMSLPAGQKCAQGRAPLLLLVVFAVMAAGLCSCRNRKATAAPISPPPPVAVVGPVAPPPAEISEPQTTAKIPESEQIPAGAVPEPLGPLAGRDDPGELAAQPAPPPQRPIQTGAADESPAPEGNEVSPPLPRLGQILTAEERQAYNRMIDNSIEAARRNLTVILSHTLRPDQMEAVRRIRAFIEQAKAARERDLALARNLADRAVLLAEDLARSFR
jgi:hypothetical protein